MAINKGKTLIDSLRNYIKKIITVFALLFTIAFGYSQTLNLYSGKGKLIKSFSTESNLTILYEPDSEVFGYENHLPKCSHISINGILNEVNETSISYSIGEGYDIELINDSELIGLYNYYYTGQNEGSINISISNITQVYHDKAMNDIGFGIGAIGLLVAVYSPLLAYNFKTKAFNEKRFNGIAGISLGISLTGYLSTLIFRDKTYYLKEDYNEVMRGKYVPGMIKVEQ